MPLSFPATGQAAFVVGLTARSAVVG